MECNIYDVGFNRIYGLDSYTSLIWKEETRGPGAFQLVLPHTIEAESALQIGMYLTKKDRPTAMIIEKAEVYKGKLWISGSTTLSFLNRRIYNGTLYVNNVEQAIYKAVNDSRPIKDIKTAALKGYTDTFVCESSYKEVLEIVSDLAIQTKMSFKMIFDRKNKRHVFEVYKGEKSPNAKYVDRFGTAFNLVILRDNSNYKNVAYVYGEGEGSARESVTVGTAQEYQRYEMYVDARDLQKGDLTLTEYRNLLRSRGIQKLNERLKRLEVSFSIPEGDYGNTIFLGDTIVGNFNNGSLKVESEINSVIQTYENNTRKTELVLGEPEIKG